jgi:hypothetical protein
MPMQKFPDLKPLYQHFFCFCGILALIFSYQAFNQFYTSAKKNNFFLIPQYSLNRAYIRLCIHGWRQGLV